MGYHVTSYYISCGAVTQFFIGKEANNDCPVDKCQQKFPNSLSFESAYKAVICLCKQAFTILGKQVAKCIEFVQRTFGLKL